jgi:integrase
MSAHRDARSGRWRYRKWIQLPDGRRIRVTGTPAVNNKKAAEDAERAHIERVLRADYRERKEVPRFADFAKEFMETYVAANNKPSERISKECIFRVQLLPVFGSKPLDQITRRDVEKYKAEMLQELSAKRVNNVLTVLSRMLKYGVELDLIDSIPRIQFVKVPPASFEFLDFEELEQLVDAATKPEERAAVLCGAEAGLRAGEIRCLEWGDIDLGRRLLTVRRTEYRGHVGSPKGGRARTIPMTNRLTHALRLSQHRRGPIVFGERDGSRRTRGSLDWVLKRVCRRAKLRLIGWHALRHTFCSHLAIRGASPRAIQELAGHASLTTTQRYMHLTEGAGRAAIDLLGQQVGNNSPSIEKSQVV